MKNLQLLLLNFRKKKWFNLIIMIAIAVAITRVILVLGKINYYTQQLKIFDANKLENVFVYGGDTPKIAINKYTEEEDKLKKVFKENKDKLVQMGTVNRTAVKMLDERQLNDEMCFTYDLVIGDNFNLDLETGKNFSDIKIDDNVVPVILNNKLKGDFKIGEKFTVEYGYSKKGTEEYSHFDENGNATRMSISDTKIKIPVEVVGFLSPDNGVIELGNASGENNLPMFDVYQSDTYVSMVLLRTPNNPLGKLEYSPKVISWVVEIKPEYIGEKFEILQKFDEIGVTHTFDNIIAGQKQEFQKNIKIPMINLIIAMSITIISIAGLNILLKVSEKKKYGIYYAYGCTWKKCVILDILKGGLLIIIPTMLAFTVATMIGKEDYFMALTPSVYIWGLVIAGLIYFISDFLFNLKMYKTKPVDNLREVE